ncbi:MAG TPA: hypothetical protein VG454_13420, partial [Gemmatimonadales bacterium]|nr:hypothetical protein [Gemmatimonadales bacterium]
MHVVRGALAVVVGIGLITACSSNSSGPSGGGHTTNISVQNNSFNPTPDTVPPGQVTFTWATPSN